ncbi:MAG: ABC transporter ATP-binding protein/permease [Oscillospiraceae bacterium]|nr:ABC transporter ATP-binding protein/permease [Oscillospiraceae bacterium]
MLLLKNIVKNYTIGDNVIRALRGVNLEFRKSEFVSILGPSGCGKTTLLNIIGGLDRYTSGDLGVNGVSTKEFKDRDWDAYRNRSVGFVFQTYNLIPHQTVLSNVELAMTLSGVSKAQRKKHATEVLKKVGLEDQIYKKPNQLSGGQMQRVAIARALVNDPEIVLADEPTGALDTGTSTQIMEIMKEIAKDRLVVMVTHNPDIAQTYSTRTIKLLDGEVISDSNPYTENELDVEPAEKSKQKGKKTAKSIRPPKVSMSFLTALALSLNNLLTKKTRTFLTAFAGSIGIIGIALILSLQNGVQLYIDTVEADTLSSYPVSIMQVSTDFSGLLGVSMGIHDRVTHEEKIEREPGRVYSYDVMVEVINSMTASVNRNDLKNFKAFLDSEKETLKKFTNDIKYGYSTTMNVYKSDTSEGGLVEWQVNPSTLLNSLNMRGASGGLGGGMGGMGAMGGMGGLDVWRELLDNDKVLGVQFDVVAGRLPQNYDEVILVVSRDDEITDFALYTLGLKDRADLRGIWRRAATEDDEEEEDEAAEEEAEPISFSYDELLELTFKLVTNPDFFEKEDGIWVDKSGNELYMKSVIEKSEEIKVVGIAHPAENAGAAAGNGAGYIGYTKALMEKLIEKVNANQAVIEQKADPGLDIFTNKPFQPEEEDDFDEEPQTLLTAEEIAAFDISVLPEEYQQYWDSGYISDEQKSEIIIEYTTGAETENPYSTSTYERNLRALGVSDISEPSSISIYPADFASKDEIIKIIDDFNKRMSDSGEDDKVIQYTDFVGLIMSSVSNIINTISIVLIAFVSIALVVSSIMIGIITYISVLERTKEIGILRSIGASKNDISRVFNAETLIVGLTAGLIGILVTILLCIPANIIIKAITEISNVAALPVFGGVGLVIISTVLTLIAGFIPSKIAAKKDPVVALRTE